MTVAQSLEPESGPTLPICKPNFAARNNATWQALPNPPTVVVPPPINGSRMAEGYIWIWPLVKPRKAMVGPGLAALAVNVVDL